MISNLTPQQLRRAAELQEEIESLQRQVQELLGGGVVSGSVSTGKRQISAAGLARIRAAQKRRWAKVHREQGGRKTRGGRGKISAAGRARIAAALKARWAAAKQAGRNAL